MSSFAAVHQPYSPKPSQKLRMSRNVQEANIQSPTARARLAVRAEPYYRSLQRGLALGYRRGKWGGTWLARTRDPIKDTYSESKIGPADDEGQKSAQAFTYDQASCRAVEIFVEEEARRNSGALPGNRRKLVNEVFDFYLAGYLSGDARKDGSPGRDVKNLNSILDAHLRPHLGSLRLDRLNATVLERFKFDLVKKPKLSRSRQPVDLSAKHLQHGADAATQLTDEFEDPALREERLRKRRSRANRVITPLRAALNYALKKKWLSTDAAWRTALRPYHNVDGASVRYLELHECAALQQHVDDDFRPLVRGALFTGGRYGSLRYLKVKDIDFGARCATFRITKSGKTQQCRLTKPACEFLKSQVRGLSPESYVFVKASGEQWKPSDQARRMDIACRKAGIEPSATFHELRDTFASHLVIAGVPILTVSKLLGHADVRITEKHYAHLRPDHLQQAVDDNLPDFSGIGRPGPPPRTRTPQMRKKTSGGRPSTLP